MTLDLDLKSSLGVSAAAHLLSVLVFTVLAGWLRPELPPIMEITLVSGPGGGGGETKSVSPPAKQDAGVVKTVKGGQVSVASPEFVTVGKRPRRTSDDLMGGGGTTTVGKTPGGQDGPGTGGGGKGRKLRYQEPLEYPDWAKAQGIDARVVLRFKVLPNGSVDTSIIVRRTSGWRKLDELAIKALRNFLFEALSHKMPQIPQWGELAFHFKPE